MTNYRQPFKGTYPITQAYGELIPGVTVNNAPHTGIDYGCPEGTPILASADGTVMAAGWDLTGYGFRVIIRHEDGRATLYAHLDSISVNFRDQVRQGQEIGLSGQSGNVTGPHLHFEARRVWNDFRTHFDPVTLPLMSFADFAAGNPENPEESSQKLAHTSQNNSACRMLHPALKEADAFAQGDLLRVQCPDGVKAFHDTGFSYSRMSSYLQGTPFYFTGDTAVRKDNGLTYMRVVPALFSVWIAVHDGDTQLLDKED